MPTSTEILAAARDAALLDRAVARAAVAGVVNPKFAVTEHALQLVIAPADSSGEPVATKHAYAAGAWSADVEYAAAIVAERETALAEARANLAAAQARVGPGANLAAVTDAHLDHAIGALIGAGTFTAGSAAGGAA